MADRGLGGLRVLVVEDEGPVAMLIEDMLEDLGCVLAGSAARVGEALELIERGGFDFALLDMNLAGQKVAPVAEALGRAGVPFAFASGYGAAPEGFGDRVPLIEKPYRESDIAAALLLLRG